MQPCVCTRELCVFAFQTLGVMADAAEAIATDADVSVHYILHVYITVTIFVLYLVDAKHAFCITGIFQS